MSNDSKQGKNQLQQALHIVGLSGITLFTAIGLLYFLKGNIFLALIIAMVPLFGLYFIINILVSKNNYRNTFEFSRDFNNAGVDIYEIILISGYGIISLFSFFMLSHSLGIEFYNKEKIVLSGKEKIMQIDSLFANYNANAASHKNTLKTDIQVRASKIKNTMNPKDISDFEAIYGRGKFTYSNGAGLDGLIQSELDKLNLKYKIVDEENKWKKDKIRAESVFNSWNRFLLSLEFFQLDQEYRKYYSLMLSKMKDFVYPDTMKKNTNGLDNPFSSMAQIGLTGNLINLLIFILINYFILVPYITTRKFKKAKVDNGTGGIRP